MGLIGWIGYAAAALAALGLAMYLYRRWETPGRGRAFLAGLRSAALAVVLLLLFNPELPVPGLGMGAARERVLLDASLSMSLPAEPGAAQTRWDRARALARELAGGRDILLFGGTPVMVGAAALESLEPVAPGSRLLPALQTASEAGVRRVVVITDGAIVDAAEVTRALPDLGLSVDIRSVGAGAVANRGIVEVDAPAWAEAGEPFEIHVGVASLGGGGEPVAVAVRQNGRTLAEDTLVSPAPGRLARTTVSLSPAAPDGGGLVRLDLELAPGDDVPDDDRRSVYVHVSADPPGVALVSLRPDWEPRYLVPVLERALGLPVRGFLRAGGDRYVRIGTGADAGRPADEARVRAAVEAADLVVLHGFGQDAPDWARRAAAQAGRVMIFPGGDAGDVGLPVTLAPPSPGEWYAADELPASPVAPLLSPMHPDLLPPLSGVRLTRTDGGAWPALTASRDRRGPPSPLTLAGEHDGRRWVVALAEGYWRWAFRGGEARQTYQRVWGALAGWLMREERAVVAAPVRPVERAIERGRSPAWVAPGLAADSIAVRLLDGDGEVAADTVVALLRGDTASTAPVPPGHYTYAVRAYSGGEEVGASEGPMTVESFSPEYTRVAGPLPDWTAAAAGSEPRAARVVAPLHTSSWPYLVLVLILSAEWVLRRRWGLR